MLRVQDTSHATCVIFNQLEKNTAPKLYSDPIYFGFEPPLNWYRNFERTWQRTASQKNNTITVPAMYLAGSKDWTHRYAESIGLDMHRQCSDLRIHEVKKAGHWIGQEEAEWVNLNIADFLALIGH